MISETFFVKFLVPQVKVVVQQWPGDQLHLLAGEEAGPGQAAAQLARGHGGVTHQVLGPGQHSPLVGVVRLQSSPPALAMAPVIQGKVDFSLRGPSEVQRVPGHELPHEVEAEVFKCFTSENWHSILVNYREAVLQMDISRFYLTSCHITLIRKFIWWPRESWRGNVWFISFICCRTKRTLSECMFFRRYFIATVSLFMSVIRYFLQKLNRPKAVLTELRGGKNPFVFLLLLESSISKALESTSGSLTILSLASDMGASIMTLNTGEREERTSTVSLMVSWSLSEPSTTVMISSLWRKKLLSLKFWLHFDEFTFLSCRWVWAC